MTTFLRALHFFRPERARLIGVFALMLAGIGAILLKPWPVAAVIDLLTHAAHRGSGSPLAVAVI
ncbi:MAG: hypothetical protein ACKODH_06475, partial [Limisphaerales bacterium]